MEIVHIHGGLCAEIKHEGVVTPPPVTVCTLPLATRGVVGRGFAQRRNGLIPRRPGQRGRRNSRRIRWSTD